MRVSRTEVYRGLLYQLNSTLNNPFNFQGTVVALHLPWLRQIPGFGVFLILYINLSPVVTIGPVYCHLLTSFPLTL